MKSLPSTKSTSGAVCPFAPKMASSSSPSSSTVAAATPAVQEEEAQDYYESHHDDHDHHNHQAPGACDSSSTSSWEPNDSQYEEDLVMMTQKCPIFQQQQQQQQKESSSSPRSITFSCPFKEQQQIATATASQNNNINNDNDIILRETLLKIPPSHYDMNEFVRVMEGFHHRVATAAAAANNSGQLLPTKCPVPLEIKNKISFRQAMENRSLAAIMARLAEEHYHQEQQQQQQQQQQEKQEQEQQQQRERADSDLTTVSNEVTTTATETAHGEATPQEQVAAATPNTTTTTATTTIITTTMTTTTPTTTSLSHELKTGTAISHQAAENVHFVRNFIRGKIDRHLYGQLVTSLYHVYTALELELDIHAPLYFASCHFPVELKRVEALQQDVDFWHGSSSAGIPEMSPATRDYVERIHDIAQTNPLLLLAHSYTRYLGDLSGGKILARVARRALNLSKPTGTASASAPVDGLHFYHFDKIESDKKFKDMYRQSLDDLSHLTSTEISQLVAEANVAFLLNMRIFEELDVAANLPGATVRPLQEALDYATAAVATSTTTTEEEPQECPFLKQQQPKQGQAMSAATTTTSTAHGGKGGGRCPWPFVVFHDPIQFVCDWQTMVLVIFISLFMIWQKAVTSTST